MKLRSLLPAVAFAFMVCSIRPAVCREAGDVTTEAATVHDAAEHPGPHIAEHAAAKHDGGHAAGGHEEAAPSAPELPNIISLVLDSKVDGKKVRNTHFGHTLHLWEKHIFLLVVVGLALLFLLKVSRLGSLKPGRLQALMEMVHQQFYSFFGDFLGEKNLHYVPFLGTVFMFIWINNMAGIIPGFAAATSVYPTTLALALMVYIYVQVNGIREGGLKHYLLHFLGSPQDLQGYIIGVCLLPLEIIGFLAKPLSLSLRLFGNIMGEDILVGVFLMMGLSIVGAFIPDPIIGIPLHFPFLFLALLTSTVQALVFTLLSAIYLTLLIPHEHHDETHHHNEKLEGLPNDENLHVGPGEISPV